MLKELFESVLAVGEARQGIVHEKPPAEPPHVYFTREPNGDLQRRVAEPAIRQHKALSLQPIVDFARRFAEADQAEEAHSGTHIAVWVSRSGVACLLNDYGRRDRIDLVLTPSEQMLTLQGFAKPQVSWFAQADFVRVLRVSLSGCVPASLIPIVRKTRFRQTEEGEREVAHTKASMGKMLERELTGAGNIPEDIPVNIPLWAGFQAHHPYIVECAIEIETATERFAIVPFPGEIEKAWRAAENDLLKHLTSLVSDIPNVGVYYGTP